MIERIMTDRNGHYCILRITERERQRLETHLFQRYPDREWGTFFRFGFRRAPWGIALSYVEALWPEAGELNEESGITTFQSDYTLRAFRMVERRDIALGVAHSHPRGGGTFPSELDDDMDGYFAEELSAYSAGMPYCSLILQRSGAGRFTFTGRVYDRGVWLPVREMLTVGDTLARERAEDELCVLQSKNGTATVDRESTTARLASVFGAAAQHRLAATTIGVIGCSGTGSPAIHVFARAGVGRFVLVDPKRLSPSNLERVHGSTSEDVSATEPPYKVDVMSRMIRAINPIAEVIVLKLNALDECALDELIRCDLVLGCVDTQHARVLLSDLAKHYLIPSTDLGVLMEGNAGRITSQIGEITQYTPELPCAFCFGRIDFLAVSRELMDSTEREQRIVAAQEGARGENAQQYWTGESPQLHSVGYLTTALGSLAAGYVEGWLTGAFAMPHSCMQFDVGQPRFGFVAVPRQQRANCPCQDHVGWADQAAAFRNIALPDHWRAEVARA